MSSICTVEQSPRDIALVSLPPANSSTSPASPSSEAGKGHDSHRIVSSAHVGDEACSSGLPSHARDISTRPTPHLRLLSCILAFFTAGLNDGSLGPLTPYFLREYSVPTSSAAWLYLSSFMGWLLVALVGSHVVTYLRIPGTLMLGAVFQVLAQVLRGWTPPFPLFAASFCVASLGQALQDSSANTFVAGVGDRAHRWLGAVHASYGLGCMVGGLVSAAVAGGGQGWWARYYWVVLGVGAANAGLVASSFGSQWFKHEAHSENDDETEPQVHDETSNKSKLALDGLKQALRNKIVWVVSLFYFFHLGVVITAGGSIPFHTKAMICSSQHWF
jgi:fucose permease